MVLICAQSEPSRRPMTLAPRNTGTIRACHSRKLFLVRSCIGGLPRAAARVELDEEELLVIRSETRVW
jgi:hypothetical protein